MTDEQVVETMDRMQVDSETRANVVLLLQWRERLRLHGPDVTQSDDIPAFIDALTGAIVKLIGLSASQR